ncbi:MAG: pilus assembly PilX N-terminal domain-containing protein, partial [Dehalococcoidia bacterium]
TCCSQEDKAKVMKDEKGQALAIAILIMVFGAMVTGALLGYLGTSVRAAGMTQEQVNAYYAADAGVEAVLADLVEDGVVVLGSYVLGESINGYDPTIDITDVIPNPAPDPQWVIDWDDYIITSTAGGVSITCYARYAESLWGNFVTIISWETS